MIKFGGLDRIYDAYSWRITRRAKEVWRTGNVVSSRHSTGSFLDKFETAVAKFTKRKYAVAVGSGTDALYFALKAKGIGPGSNVLCPAVSYLATAEAIKRTGATITFDDGKRKYLLHNKAAITAKATSNNAIITLVNIPPHSNYAFEVKNTYHEI